MLNQYTMTQNVADLLKAVIDRTKGKKAHVFDSLQEFERAGWVAAIFDGVLAGIDGIRYEDGQLIIEGSDQEKLARIQYVLNAYLDIATGRMSVLDANEAASYLGISYAMFRKYLYVENADIPSEKKGNMLLFKRRDLYEFDLTRRKQGRPPAK